MVNGITLLLASCIAVNWFDVYFYVDSFWAAVLGAAIVSVVTVILSVFVREDED